MAENHIPLQAIKFFRDESEGLVTSIDILNHAYRLNGKVDVFKYGFCVYDLRRHKYTTLELRGEVFPFVQSILEGGEPIEVQVKKETQMKRKDPKPEKVEQLKPTPVVKQEIKEVVPPKPKSTKITFQEFNKRRQVADWRPEQYHWENFAEEKSEDHLYFIKDGDAIKVGRSLNPKKRLAQMQTGSKTKLYLLFVAENKGCLEKNIHSCLKGLHIRGEWYKFTPRVVDLLQFIYEKSPELVTKKPTYIKKKKAA